MKFVNVAQNCQITAAHASVHSALQPLLKYDLDEGIIRIAIAGLTGLEATKEQGRIITWSSSSTTQGH